MRPDELSEQQLQDALEIGRALKQIDRSLLGEWTSWCENTFSANTYLTLWDSFPPLACDVHNTAASEVNKYFYSR